MIETSSLNNIGSSFVDIVDNLDEAVAIYRRDAENIVTVTVSNGFIKLFGFISRDEAIDVMNNDMYRDTHPKDKARIQEAAILFSKYDDTYDVTYRTRSALGGAWFLVRARGAHFCNAQYGQISVVVYTTEEDSSYVLSNRLGGESSYHELSDIERFDKLTGLPSLENFMHQLQMRMTRCMSGAISVVYMDVSDMKSVNSIDGIDVGDKVLQRIGEAMASVFGSELCTRASGDRFMAMVPSGLAAPLVGRVVDLVSRTHRKRTMHVHVGIYDVRDNDTNAILACDRAKWAALADAGIHASTVARFDADMARAMETDRYVRSHIDDIFENGCIHVWYQPIVRAGTRDIVHYEALARWIKSSGDMLSPLAFVPTLESAKACMILDRFVMHTVATDIKNCKLAGCIATKCSVNVSRTDLSDMNIAAEIASALDKYDISHDMVAIEITESAAESDVNLLLKQMDDLHSQGFAVWMDDFGEGLSSLGALQRLDFDLVKLDRGLVRNIIDSQRARTVAGYAIEMAKSIGVPVIAEGIELVEQEQLLVDMNCDYLQGYLYGKPAPLAMSV